MVTLLWIVGVILALPQGAIPLFQLLSGDEPGNALLAANLLPTNLRVAGCVAALVLGLASIVTAEAINRSRKRVKRS